MCQPDLRFDTLAEITPAVLGARGIRALLVDLDDTLVPSDSEEPASGALEWLSGLRAAGVAVAIVSNGSRRRVARFAEQAGMPAIAMAGKPFAQAFRRARGLLGAPDPATVAMVGDQLFTDVVGARRAGMVTILVRPLSKGKLPHTRIARHLERMFLKER